MNGKRLIIDGNNLIHADPELAGEARRSFDHARLLLVRKLDELAGAMDCEQITVVFDGRGVSAQWECRSPHVRVLFCPEGFTADSVIERLVHADEDRSRVQVVTSDRGERDTVEAAGATSTACSIFSDHMRSQRRHLSAKVRNARSDGPATRLGDFFPKVE